MYFLANDPQVPAPLKERVNTWGLDPQEFTETGFWPHQLYVREGRRMVSDYVVTQGDCESGGSLKTPSVWLRIQWIHTFASEWWWKKTEF